MEPIEWLTFGQLLITAGTKFAVEWANLLAKAKEGKPVTVEERNAALAKIEYRTIITNTFLPPA